jgi:hypothetical protein
MSKFTLDSTPEHYIQGADTNHFLSLCEECDVHYVLSKSFGEVQEWYFQGRISADLWEAYAHAWATAVDHGEWADHWRAVPESATARRLANTIRVIYDRIRTGES